MAATGMVLLWAGRALLWLAGLLLGLALLALVLPAWAVLRYEKEELSVKVGILFFGVRVWPERELTEVQKAKKQARAEKKRLREEKRRAKKAAKHPAPPPPPPTGKKRAKLTLDAVCEMLCAAGVFLRAVFGALRVTHISIYLPVSGQDAADTALAYGKTNAWLHSALAVLNNFLYLDFDRLRVEPDFTNKLAGTESFSCKISAQLIIMIIAAVRLGITLLRKNLLAPFLPVGKARTKQ